MSNDFSHLHEISVLLNYKEAPSRQGSVYIRTCQKEAKPSIVYSFSEKNPLIHYQVWHFMPFVISNCLVKLYIVIILMKIYYTFLKKQVDRIKFPCNKSVYPAHNLNIRQKLLLFVVSALIYKITAAAMDIVTSPKYTYTP